MANNFELIPAFYLVVPFFCLLIFINWLGYRFKIRYIKKFPGIDHVGIGPTEGSLLGLTALLLSFTFGMSATKYELRRQHLISEITDIETTILRADMYSDSARSLIRADLKNYVEKRIDYYAVGDREDLIAKSIFQSDSISAIIWKRVAILSRDPGNLAASQQMVPAVNAMIDIVTTREGGRKAVVPRLILIILCTLILVSAFLSGYGSKNLERNKVLVVAFAFITTLALYLVLDLDRPRQGFVNLNTAQKLMVDLRNHFDSRSN
jgi:hypothetical protein